MAATLTTQEIATGFLFGRTPVPIPREVLDPRGALEAIIRPALTRAPCIIGFSGGRDSSALLAVTVALARREGRPLPVPVTLEYEGSRTQEREWQELVLSHLRLEDWVRLRPGYDLDFVGPVAGRGLARHGVLFPANAHTIVPLAEVAGGGSVLTGIGGDDTFGSWPWHDLADVGARRRRARVGDIRRTAHALAPRWLRAEVLRRRRPLGLPWLRPDVRRATSARYAAELCSIPRTWAARMQWSAGWRPWREAARSVELLGADYGVAVCSPFLDPGYLAALAAAGGRWGWGDRTHTMRALFGDVLPESVIARRGKAEFSQPFFGTHTRRFAAEWDGVAGIDPGLVDPEALRWAWTAEQPHGMSAMGLQAAWLASLDSGSVDGAEAPATVAGA